MSLLYRVAWKALNGNTGRGPGKYPYDEAKRSADTLNEQDKDLGLHHWPELVVDDNPCYKDLPPKP